jgi:hypothetical protein
MNKTFTGTGAARDAEAWCEERGISIGRMQQGSPRGLLVGDFEIQKWRNLNAKERAALHGVMTGDMRNGPVMIKLYAHCPAVAP